MPARFFYQRRREIVTRYIIPDGKKSDWRVQIGRDYSIKHAVNHLAWTSSLYPGLVAAALKALFELAVLIGGAALPGQTLAWGGGLFNSNHVSVRSLVLGPRNRGVHPHYARSEGYLV